jgi:hypothetical protein
MFRTLAFLVLVMVLGSAPTAAQSTDGYVGIFADTSATQWCVNAPQGTPARPPVKHSFPRPRVAERATS